MYEEQPFKNFKTLLEVFIARNWIFSMNERKEKRGKNLYMYVYIVDKKQIFYMKQKGLIIG